MSKKIVIVLYLILLVFSSVSANENNDIPEFNWNDYSYEELLIIQENLNSVVAEKQREWAIENGNRVIDFDKNDFTLYTTQTQTITPTVTRVVDDAPTTTRFVWSSSDDSIARVSASGMVTGVSMGDAEITCTAADDEFIFKTTTVHVVLPVTAVTISEPKITLLLSDKPEEGEIVLSAVIAPENAFCQDVTWKSSNEAIAVIDADGNVKAKAPGTAVITAVSNDSFSAYPKQATASVTVLQAVSGIELDQTELTMNKNAYTTLKASVLPTNASQKTLSWESSDPTIVRVSNGQITAVSTGEAVITCSSTDGSNISVQSRITVIQMVTGIRFNEPSATLTLNMDDSRSLNTIITPDDATNKELTWISSNENVVVVNEKGVIKAVGGGNASISCKSVDGSEKSASISVFVPSITIADDKIIVSEKTGLDLEVPFYGNPEKFSYTPAETAFFKISDTWDGENKKFMLHIDPGKAGSSQVYLKDADDAKSTKTITITIEHSAAYDAVSYPNVNYKEVQRYPEKYKGKNISIYGRVLQKWVDDGLVGLFVGPTWSQFYLVTYYAENIDLNVLENDYITVYGISSGDYTYETTRGSANTVPSIVAERIYMGAH